MHERVTLLRPEALRPDARGISSALPPDLLGQSAERLRILALLYAFAFFMAGIFPMLVVPADRALLFGTPAHSGGTRRPRAVLSGKGPCESTAAGLLRRRRRRRWAS